MVMSKRMYSCLVKKGTNVFAPKSCRWKLQLRCIYKRERGSRLRGGLFFFPHKTRSPLPTHSKANLFKSLKIPPPYISAPKRNAMKCKSGSYAAEEVVTPYHQMFPHSKHTRHTLKADPSVIVDIMSWKFKTFNWGEPTL